MQHWHGLHWLCLVEEQTPGSSGLVTNWPRGLQITLLPDLPKPSMLRQTQRGYATTTVIINSTHCEADHGCMQGFDLQKAWKTLRSIFTPRPVRPVLFEEPPQDRDPPQDSAATSEQAPTAAEAEPEALIELFTPEATAPEQALQEPVAAAAVEARPEASSVQEADEAQSRPGVAVMEREPETTSIRLEAQVVKDISKVTPCSQAQKTIPLAAAVLALLLIVADAV